MQGGVRKIYSRCVSDTLPSMLKVIGTNIWTMDGPKIVFAGAPMNTRMTIVRLGNGNLWVHSPIKYSPEAAQAIESLGGSVTALVAPNKFHHMFIGQWKEAHPSACVFAESTVQKKILFLQSAEELSDTAPDEYGDDIEQLVFAGNRFFQEVVFFHKESKTLILTDMMINLRAEGIKLLPRLLLRFEGAVFPNGGVTRLYRLFTWDKVRARESVAKIRAWSPQTLTFCHGEPLSDPVDNVLEQQFRWLDS